MKIQAMARLGCCCVALGVVLAACGGTAKTATPPSTSARTTAVAMSTTRAKVDFGKIYRRLVAPVVAAETRAKAVPDNASLAVFAKALAPVGTALEAFDTGLLATHWPATTETDVKALVTANGSSINDLHGLSGQSLLSLNSWETQLGSDLGKSTSLSQIVRSDLGLSPT